MHAPSQWETTLNCNAISHWLGAYTKWSLDFHENSKHCIQGNPYRLWSGLNVLTLISYMISAFRHHIIVTSHKGHGVSNHRQRECLFNSLSRVITQKTSKRRTTSPLRRKSNGVSSQRTDNPEIVSISPWHPDTWLSKTSWSLWPEDGAPFYHVIVRRAGLLWSQQDFEWRWSVPLFKCLTVLEFSFILFDLCLLITFFNFIMNYVPIVTFWIFTYHKIWILSIMFCFIWSYWIIYFLACLEVSWRVVS